MTGSVVQSGEIDTLVVGGLGVPHLVLERDRIAERWRTARWDSLVANGPAWHDRFPGLEFDGTDPDAFPGKERVAEYFEAYAERFDAPSVAAWRSRGWTATPTAPASATGGEMGPIYSAGLKVADRAAWPVVDLQVDWHIAPLTELRMIWDHYRPQRDTYVLRAVRPDESPSYGVPGDER